MSASVCAIDFVTYREHVHPNSGRLGFFDTQSRRQALNFILQRLPIDFCIILQFRYENCFCRQFLVMFHCQHVNKVRCKFALLG